MNKTFFLKLSYRLNCIWFDSSQYFWFYSISNDKWVTKLVQRRYVCVSTPCFIFFLYLALWIGYHFSATTYQSFRSQHFRIGISCGCQIKNTISGWNQIESSILFLRNIEISHQKKIQLKETNCRLNKNLLIHLLGPYPFPLS